MQKLEIVIVIFVMKVMEMELICFNYTTIQLYV